MVVPKLNVELDFTIAVFRSPTQVWQVTGSGYAILHLSAAYVSEVGEEIFERTKAACGLSIGYLRPLVLRTKQFVHCPLIAYHRIQTTRELRRRANPINESYCWGHVFTIHLRQPFEPLDVYRGSGKPLDKTVDALQHDHLLLKHSGSYQSAPPPFAAGRRVGRPRSRPRPTTPWLGI